LPTALSSLGADSMTVVVSLNVSATNVAVRESAPTGKATDDLTMLLMSFVIVVMIMFP
jgi:hypothetical protein